MKSSGIGGQAVLEGIMMKNKEKYAIAIRKPDNEVVVKLDEYKGIGERNSFFKLPIVRGIAAFIESLLIGVKTMTYSAEFYEDESDDNKKKKKIPDGVMNALTVIFAVVLAVGIFMVLPYLIAQLLKNIIESQKILTLFEGVFRIILFIGYISIISLMEDIKRVFMYHGAEHKVINCIENGYDLTVKNVRLQSKHHKRCGTSFSLYVIFLSVLFFMFINVDSSVLKLILRLLLVPIIAGVSYEFIRLAGKVDNKLMNILSKPGFLLQGLTTKEPDNSMIEVAIVSVEAVFDWKAFIKENGRETSLNKHIKEESKSKSELQSKAAVNQISKLLSIDNNLDDGELNGLDKVLDVAELTKRKIKSESTLSKRSASFDPAAAVSKEEDDEVLMALDKFFAFDNENDEEEF